MLCLFQCTWESLLEEITSVRHSFILEHSAFPVLYTVSLFTVTSVICFTCAFAPCLTLSLCQIVCFLFPSSLLNLCSLIMIDLDPCLSINLPLAEPSHLNCKFDSAVLVLEFFLSLALLLSCLTRCCGSRTSWIWIPYSGFWTISVDFCLSVLQQYLCFDLHS